jgi:hypothetical protein
MRNILIQSLITFGISFTLSFMSDYFSFETMVIVALSVISSHLIKYKYEKNPYKS